MLGFQEFDYLMHKSKIEKSNISKLLYTPDKVNPIETKTQGKLKIHNVSYIFSYI